MKIFSLILGGNVPMSDSCWSLLGHAATSRGCRTLKGLGHLCYLGIGVSHRKQYIKCLY